MVFERRAVISSKAGPGTAGGERRRAQTTDQLHLLDRVLFDGRAKAVDDLLRPIQTDVFAKGDE
jgi:hypothetical protein